MVPEQRVKTCTYKVCTMVKELCEKRTPYTVCKMVPEQRVKTCTYQVCKMVPEQRTCTYQVHDQFSNSGPAPTESEWCPSPVRENLHLQGLQDGGEQRTCTYEFARCPKCVRTCTYKVCKMG
jgi:hypothetical protein